MTNSLGMKYIVISLLSKMPKMTKVPKMPKIKDFDHFIKEEAPNG